MSMGDLALLTLGNGFKHFTGESAGDIYTKALLENEDVWAGPYSSWAASTPYA